jgi:ureidoglycolate hydrolase
VRPLPISHIQALAIVQYNEKQTNNGTVPKYIDKAKIESKSTDKVEIESKSIDKAEIESKSIDKVEIESKSIDKRR